jgi:hypothetical protein
MFAYHFTTAGTTNLTQITTGNRSNDYKGCYAANTAAYAIYLKLYWQGNSNSAPVVGTTVPNATIQIPITGLNDHIRDALTSVGPLWVAVTKLAADTDTTAVVAGDGVITLLLE